MKRALLMLAVLCFVACGKGKSDRKESSAPSIQGKKASSQFQKHVDAGHAQPTEKTVKLSPRQRLLQAEWEAYEDHLITHSAAKLPPTEKEMLRHLIEAAEIVHELYMLQIHPKNLEMLRSVKDQGTKLEKQIFNRYQMPWCADNRSADCCVLQKCPKRDIGLVHWPRDLTDEEFRGLERQINGRELLSPFTIVERNPQGGFRAIPYSKTALLGERMTKLAEQLKLAAAKAPSKSLSTFLDSRARAFESGLPYPYDESDYDWIALEGQWEVTVGPYEVYKNPRQLKALFEMYIAREEPGMTAELAKLKANLQEMEDALGELVGPEIYQSRKLDERIAIRVVDVWMATGDARRGRGATVAFHLPNRGKAVDEGLYKKVLMVNHMRAFEPVTRARAEIVLDREQMQYVDLRANIENVTFHELAHGFGAHHDLKITTKSGTTATVKLALREYDTLLEEAKADTIGYWLVQFQKRKGWLTTETMRKRYISMLMHHIGLLQYPLDGVYPRMVAIQMGWYLDAGAIIWDAEDGRFSVDFKKIPKAIESLAKKVATIQLTGDFEGAKKLVEQYVLEKGEKKFELKGKLAGAREKILAKFGSAGIKSPSLRYEIKF